MDYSCDTIKNIINKGVHAIIRAHGDGLTVGKQYTCCLYYKAQVDEFRAEQISEAVVSGQDVYCIFDFTPEQTAALKSGAVVRLEIYDTETKKSMYFNDEYAIVRATSLNA